MLTPSGGCAWRLDTALPAAWLAMLPAVARLTVGRWFARMPMTSDAATATTSRAPPTLFSVIMRPIRRSRRNRGGRDGGAEPFGASPLPGGLPGGVAVRPVGGTGDHLTPGVGIGGPPLLTSPRYSRYPQMNLRVSCECVEKRSSIVEELDSHWTWTWTQRGPRRRANGDSTEASSSANTGWA